MVDYVNAATSAHDEQIAEQERRAAAEEQVRQHAVANFEAACTPRLNTLLANTLGGEPNDPDFTELTWVISPNRRNDAYAHPNHGDLWHDCGNGFELWTEFQKIPIAARVASSVVWTEHPYATFEVRRPDGGVGWNFDGLASFGAAVRKHASASAAATSNLDARP